MKKLMIPAIAISMFMASCGGVESDAEKICDLYKERLELKKEGDKAKFEEFEAEMKAEMKELEAKYPKGTAEFKELESLVKPCLEEARNSVGK